jgi:hypothetical protein
VHALLPILTLHAASVVVAPGPDEGCPSARQVEAALARAQPAQVGAAESVITLVLPPPGTPMEPSFSLVDGEGRLKLFRSLTKPKTARARSCMALADTVALIVRRYLEEVEVPAGLVAEVKRPIPEPSQPALDVASLPAVEQPRPATWDFGLVGALRAAPEVTGLSDLDAQVSIGRTMPLAAGALVVAVSGGMAGRVSRAWDGGRGTLQRYPGSLAVLWSHRLGLGSLQLGPIYLADLLGMQARSDDGHRLSLWRVASAIGGQIGVRLCASDNVFLRVAGDLAVAMVRYEYLAPVAADGVVLSTPALYGNFRIAAGVSFR